MSENHEERPEPGHLHVHEHLDGVRHAHVHGHHDHEHDHEHAPNEPREGRENAATGGPHAAGSAR